MSSETLEVKKRELVGSNAVKQLRNKGEVPAILYGHGEANINLSVRADAINNIIKHGTKMLSLTGGVTDTAILRDVQWDAFGMDVLHVDFTRVSQTEAVEVSLPVELHGEAPGTSEGGVLNFTMHEVSILCPASSIPEHIVVNISKLHVGDAIHASDIALPAGASMVTAAHEVVVQISKPAGGGDVTAESEASAEPELIRKEKAEEE